MDALLTPPGRLLLAATGLLGLVGLAEGLRAAGVHAGTTRRLVHVGVGGFVVATPWLFEAPIPVYGLALLFGVVNAMTRAFGWWKATHGGRIKSWGTITFPLAVLPCLAATWSVDPARTPFFQAAFLVLAVADPSATWVGRSISKPSEFTLGSDRKTISGSTAFLIVAFAMSVAFLMLVEWPEGRPGVLSVMAASGALALVTTAVEALSVRGWDNFFIPVAGVLVLLVVEETGARTVWTSLLGAGLFGAVALRSNVLTREAAVAASLFAALLIAVGWAWLLPGLVFFGLSSALSLLPGGNSSGGRGGDNSTTRSVKQVYANGGVAWFFAMGHVFWPHPFWYAGAIGAFAAAAADTWATEIGTRLSTQAWSLRSRTFVRSGTSGAVSVSGSLAAVIGAATVVGAAVLGGGLAGSEWHTVFGLVGAGLLGMMVDSVMGATVQAQYRRPGADSLTEEPHQAGEPPVRGRAYINNEIVNLAGTLTGAIAALLV